MNYSTWKAKFMKFDLLDHGYVRFIENWGIGDARLPEAAIIEAARQSTQGSFRAWGAYHHCTKCNEVWVGHLGDREAVKHFYFNMQSPHADCEHTWKEYPKGDEGLLSFLYNNHHSTPFEFAGMTIEIQAPIFIFREWHRHRTQSYNEMSARYEPLPNLHYLPTIERLMIGVDSKNKQAMTINGAPPLTLPEALNFQKMLKALNNDSQAIYEMGLKAGVPKELARLTNNVNRYSRMRASGNLRNFLGFMTLRSAPDAMWEMQQYSNAVSDVINIRFPKTFKLWDLNFQKRMQK
jgi:thymidylate synthase (FAD)